MRLWIALLLTALTLAATTARAAEFDEGIEYKLIEPAMRATNDDGKVEVAEVFWYGCPHCYHLEPDVNAWLAHKPADVDFVRVPAPLNPSWAAHSRAFYAAQALGVLDKTHEALFEAIHKDHRALFTDEALAEFYAEHGVDATTYLQMARSFGVAKDVRRATVLGRAWGVHGVPAFVVNGKYLTNVELAGGEKKLFEVIDYLVAKEAKSEQPAAQPAPASGH